MAMKYRKKPVVVEAIQWTGKNLQELKNFVGDSLEYDVMDAAWEIGKGPVIVNVRIQTLEGIHHASVGDFIIKGIRGEFYPCKPDIFAKTYESATLTPPNEPLTLISMSDEIPPDNERVLVYRPCMVDSDTGPYSVQWGWAAKRDGSHWARLPDRRPPEGEEDT